jgi:hypothetical protein
MKKMIVTPGNVISAVPEFRTRGLLDRKYVPTLLKRDGLPATTSVPI